MARGGDFALVFTQNPPAADIFKRTKFSDIGAFAVGTERRVKMPSWEECTGVILSTGMPFSTANDHFATPDYVVTM